MKKHYSVQYFVYTLVSVTAGITLAKQVWLEKFHLQKKEKESVERERDLFYTWFLLAQHDISIHDFFAEQGIQTVGIMGMSRLGRRAVDSLGDRVVYAVEAENFAAVHERLTVWRLGENPLPTADAILITDLDNVREKAEAVRREFSGRIVTLCEVLRWLLERHGIEPRDGAIAGWPPESLIYEELG